MLNSPYFRFDALSNFVGLFVAVFTVLIAVYSFGFMRGRKGKALYYLYILLTCAASLGAVFANHLIVFIVCWGFLGFLLYLLIGLGEKERTPATAKKTMIIIGGTDAFMLLGIAYVAHLAGTLYVDGINIALTSRPAVWAYLLLALGAFAKSGAMPLHTWVPDAAEDAPTPVSAYLPAALDKLLGIYFLARLSLDMFVMDAAMNTFLMALGSITIICAVMMALVQHDLKRLLGYHAVSQVGYMVLGIGTGNPIGIAGGLFHMLNNAIYKSCLFLSAGAVERKAGTTDLEKLGGFARIMPISFVTFLIASCAISGIPPFNGFASKWMIYQGVIEYGKSGGYLWIVWLVAAFFGSALTLASFMKLIHAVFLGQQSRDARVSVSDKQEAPVTMWIPQAVLAALCIVFGVFAYRLPLALYILPSVGKPVVFTGIWSANMASALLLAGIVIGMIILLLGKASSARETDAFVCGESLERNPDMRVSGTEFYATIQEMGLFKGIYAFAQQKLFDPYEVGTKITFGLNSVLRRIHNGVLPTYLAWCLLGITVLFYILFR